MGGLLCYPTEKSYNLSGRKYTVTRLLGEGGFSFVYLVKDSSGRKYALKSMLCQTPEALNTGRKEIEIFKQYDHPNILKLIDSSIIKSKTVQGAQEILILMPFYKEGTLQDIIDRQRTINGFNCTTSFFNQREILIMFNQICEAIYHFHKSNPCLAHRDIKPGNILLSDDKKPVLMDFGSTTEARIIVSSRKQALEVQEEADQHSTPLYRPPELFDVGSDARIDERTDVWSLGCLLYAMSFNRSPFESSSEDKSGSVALSVLSGKIDFPSTHPYTNDFIGLISSMLTHNSLERPFLDKVLNQIDQVLRNS